jgi:hypothetical protein
MLPWRRLFAHPLELFFFTQRQIVMSQLVEENSIISNFNENETGPSLEKIKLIFLDINGVLDNCHGEDFADDCMGHLKSICESVENVYIVVSSTYRLSPSSMKMIWEKLTEVGITKDRYQLHSHIATPHLSYAGKTRTEEILMSLDSLKNIYHVETWVAIDDMALDEMGTQTNKVRIAPNFVRCNPATGLQSVEAMYAISLLTNT